jgi:transposase
LKNSEEVMEILEAFDLTGSLRGAAELAGCDHKTVAHWVRARDEAGGGGLPVPARRRPRVDAFAEKIEEWVDRSRGKIRADAAHQRLVAMGYQGSERTTRRAVAAAKRAWRAEHGRRTRPWVTEPGLWMQWDYGDGPKVAGRSTVLFCAWLAWSRFRVVVPLWDRTMPSVVMALDRALHAFGGGPTYALTDNERTISIDQVCGVAVRNPQVVSVGRHYGLTIATCVPGGSGEQGRLGGDGPDRQGRPGPDRPLPARGLRGLRRARGGSSRRTPRPVRARVALASVGERQERSHLPPGPRLACGTQQPAARAPPGGGRDRRSFGPPAAPLRRATETESTRSLRRRAEHRGDA